MTINDPVANDPANVNDPMGIGFGSLCHTSGHSSEDPTEIVAIYAACEKIAAQNTAPSYDCNTVKSKNKSLLRIGGDWDDTLIPDAQCHPSVGTKQWNVLHICTFVRGYPPPSTPELVKFRGVRGTYPAILTVDEDEAEAKKRKAGFPNFDRMSELVDAWWNRDIASATLPLHEPVDKDGRWLLYRRLPVDTDTGSVLGWRGRPLRATSLSVAVAHVDVKRKCPFYMTPPPVQISNPFGTGQAGLNVGSVAWPFVGFPAFGTIVFQNATADSQLFAQAILSACRKSPTHVFTDLNRPIRIGINSPAAEDWMNEGHLDVWVRVDSR